MSKQITYTMGRSKGETQRLVQQSQLYDLFTHRLIDNAGIQKGMRVLDVGSGSGNVALALAEKVGPTGEVVGIDMNAEILNHADQMVKDSGYSNTTFISGDIQTIQLDKIFDAIVGRLVLMYLPNPAETIKHLMSFLKPGGIVAFEEVDLRLYQNFNDPSMSLLNQLADWFFDAFKQSGANTSMGMDLTPCFINAGLPSPTIDYSAPAGSHADWVGYDYVKETFKSLMPLFERFNIVTEEELDLDTLEARVKKEVLKNKKPLILPPHFSVWANSNKTG